MTEIETLREAARLMRERAEAATSGRWYRDAYAEVRAPLGPVVSHDEGVAVNEPDAGHIAGMDPAVALAVSWGLDAAARDLWAHGPLCTHCEQGCERCDDELWMPHVRCALTIARTYLRDEPS